MTNGLNGRRLPALPAACMSALAVDQVQLLGAHNTYHQVPTSRSFLQTIMQGLVIDGFLTSGDQAIAQAFARRLSLNYNNYTDILSTHGISAVEIDLWKDTQGGRFRYAALKKLIGATSGVSGDLGAAMSVPGYKVMHNIDVVSASAAHSTYARGRVPDNPWLPAMP